MRASEYFLTLPKPVVVIVKVANMSTLSAKTAFAEVPPAAGSGTDRALTRELRQPIDYYIAIKTADDHVKYGLIVTCYPALISEQVYTILSHEEFRQKCVASVNPTVTAYDRYGTQTKSIVASHWWGPNDVIAEVMERLNVGHYFAITKNLPYAGAPCRQVTWVRDTVNDGFKLERGQERRPAPRDNTGYGGYLSLMLRMNTTKTSVMKSCEPPTGAIEPVLMRRDFDDAQCVASSMISGIMSDPMRDIINEYDMVDSAVRPVDL